MKREKNKCHLKLYTNYSHNNSAALQFTTNRLNISLLGDKVNHLQYSESLLFTG